MPALYAIANLHMQFQLAVFVLAVVCSLAHCVSLKELAKADDEKEIPGLSLIQIAQNVVRASVAAGGSVNSPLEAAATTLTAAVQEAAGVSPVPAFSEADAEDFDGIHLLQTSRDVKPPLQTKAPSADAHATNTVSASEVPVASLNAATAKLSAVAAATPRAFTLQAATPFKMHQLRAPGKGIEVRANPKQFPTRAASPLEEVLTSPLFPVMHGLRGLAGRRSMLESLGALLCFGLCMAALLLMMVGMKKCMSWCIKKYTSADDRNLRQSVEAMSRTPGAEVVSQLIAGGLYDCAIMRPLSSKQMLRLEVRVEEAASGFCLWTPLTQQACVRYVATVSRQVAGSKLPVPVAHHSASIDFVVSLIDAPHVRIDIEGQDLSTFDMTAGRCSAQRTFQSAAQHWQDFVTTRQIGGKSRPSAQTMAKQAVLDFQETAIVLGSSVTVVGELHRNAVGTLTLRPLFEDPFETQVSTKLPSKQDTWRTSWEKHGCSDTSSKTSATGRPAGSREPWMGKVWVTDDPALLRLGG